MTLVRRVLSEPLVQFLLIGICVFGLYSAVERSSPEAEPQSIEIGPGRIAQLLETFSRTWQRPPSRDEVNGLIEAFIKEEIFYREGRKAGLDRDDTVFRRRLQQKMEFLMEPTAAELTPTEKELQTLLDAKADMFRIAERVAFRQIFFDLQKRGDPARAQVEALSNTLRSDIQALDLDELGDPTLLPRAMQLTPVEEIESTFGADFTNALGHAETGRWTGPVESTFGLHLIHIDDRTPARMPELDEIRAVVLREWQTEKRHAIAEERYRSVRAKYDVTVAWPEPKTTSVPSGTATTQ